MKRHEKKPAQGTSFDADLKDWLKDPTFREGFLREKLRLEVSLLMIALRKKKRVSQKALAARLRTSQSAIARLESGKVNMTIDTLGKIAGELGAKVTIGLH